MPKLFAKQKKESNLIEQQKARKRENHRKLMAAEDAEAEIVMNRASQAEAKGMQEIIRAEQKLCLNAEKIRESELLIQDLQEGAATLSLTDINVEDAVSVVFGVNALDEPKFKDNIKSALRKKCQGYLGLREMSMTQNREKLYRELATAFKGEFKIEGFGNKVIGFFKNLVAPDKPHIYFKEHQRHILPKTTTPILGYKIDTVENNLGTIALNIFDSTFPSLKEKAEVLIEEPIQSQTRKNA